MRRPTVVRSCSSCRRPIEKQRPRSNYCRQCGRLRARLYRAARPYASLPEHQKARNRAYAYLHSYVRRGRLVKPDRCTLCGRRPRHGVIAHLPDLEHPLNAQWLCPRCKRWAGRPARISTPLS